MWQVIQPCAFISFILNYNKLWSNKNFFLFQRCKWNDSKVTWNDCKRYTGILQTENIILNSYWFILLILSRIFNVDLIASHSTIQHDIIIQMHKNNILNCSGFIFDNENKTAPVLKAVLLNSATHFSNGFLT